MCLKLNRKLMAKYKDCHIILKIIRVIKATHNQFIQLNQLYKFISRRIHIKKFNVPCKSSIILTSYFYNVVKLIVR